MLGRAFWLGPPFNLIWFFPNLSVWFPSKLFVPELFEACLEAASVVRRGSLDPWPEEPFVVAVAVEGKKFPL